MLGGGVQGHLHLLAVHAVTMVLLHTGCHVLPLPLLLRQHHASNSSKRPAAATPAILPLCLARLRVCVLSIHHGAMAMRLLLHIAGPHHAVLLLLPM